MAYVLWMALIDLPKRKSHKFWHPDSVDLILTAASMTAVFSFWNAINIRPSMLTDPGYQELRLGIERDMKISLVAILGISSAFALIYGKDGYIPAAAAAATGVGMYLWTDYELNNSNPVAEVIGGSEDLYQDAIDKTDASSLRATSTNYPLIFSPMSLNQAALPRRKLKDQVGMN